MKRRDWLLLLLLFVVSLLLITGGGMAGEQISIIDPSSSFILYSRADGTSWLKDTDGDRMILDGYHPRLSPDGRYIVVQRGPALGGDLYRYDLETKQDTLIFENNDEVVGWSWKADGSRIYYDYACEIKAMNPDGSNQATILGYWPPDDLESHGCYNDAPDVNPIDGRIAWHNYWHGIGLAEGDGKNPHMIMNTATDDWNPRWSPDGEWIAFTRIEKLTWVGNLYKIKPDGTNLTQLTFLGPLDTLTVWSGPWEKGGSWIFVIADVHGEGRLFAVAADGSGKMVPLYIEPGADPPFVGSAGKWEFNFLYFYLPQVRR